MSIVFTPYTYTQTHTQQHTKLDFCNLIANNISVQIIETEHLTKNTRKKNNNTHHNNNNNSSSY